jgi:hypothetical protein
MQQEGWDRVYEPAIITALHEGGTKFTVRFEVGLDGTATDEVVDRDQIRRLSLNDQTIPLVFEPADVVLYDTGINGAYKSSMISKRHNDGTYDLTIMNWEGYKHFHVPRSRLMFEAESSEFYKEIPALTRDQITDAFIGALFESRIVTGQDISELSPRTIQVGEGILVHAFWSNGHAILKWNGQVRVEVNIYLEKEDRSVRMNFQTKFIEAVGNLAIVQFDEFPRGYGSLINFESDMKDPPNWLSKEFMPL